MNALVAVAAIVVREGELLAMQRSHRKDAGAGMWETLSGRVEPGESLLEAIAREVEEESGLVGEIDPRPVDAYLAKRGDAAMSVVVYRVDVPSGSQVVMSEEHDDFAWVSLERFRELTPFRRLAEAAERALGA